jgi:hypothetical protein
MAPWMPEEDHQLSIVLQRLLFVSPTVPSAVAYLQSNLPSITQLMPLRTTRSDAMIAERLESIGIALMQRTCISSHRRVVSIDSPCSSSSSVGTAPTAAMWTAEEDRWLTHVLLTFDTGLMRYRVRSPSSRWWI